MKEPTDNIQTTLSELSVFPVFLWQYLRYLAEYRKELLITEVMVFPSGDAYYVCPRCNITLEREFMSYCNRCGQHLGGREYKKARIIHPGRRKSTYLKMQLNK